MTRAGAPPVPSHRRALRRARPRLREPDPRSRSRSRRRPTSSSARSSSSASASPARSSRRSWPSSGRTTGGAAGPALEASLSENWRRIGEIFVTRGFVTEEELERALTRQRQTGERLGEALVGLGVISKFELAGALGEQMSTVDEPVAGGEVRQAEVVQLHTVQPANDETVESEGLAAVEEVAAARDESVSEAVAETHVEPLALVEVEGQRSPRSRTRPRCRSSRSSPSPRSSPSRSSRSRSSRSRSSRSTVPSQRSSRSHRSSPWRWTSPGAGLARGRVRPARAAAADAGHGEWTGSRTSPRPTCGPLRASRTSRRPPATRWCRSARDAPEVGAVIEIEGHGALVVVRHARSPLPHDDRTCLVVEPSAQPLVYSFA